MLSRDKYCILVSLLPKKDLSRIKGVLDEALIGYTKHGGTFKPKEEWKRPNGKNGFKHITEFPCIKQPVGSVKEAFYALHHLKGIVWDADNMNQPARLRDWSNRMAGEMSDADIRDDFHRIQVQLSQIILEDVQKNGGSLNQPRGLCQRDIQERLERQSDKRTWTTKDMYKPFPAPLEPLKKKSN